MVNSVSHTTTTPPKAPKAANVSIFYMNDIHGQLSNMRRIKTAADSFDSFTPVDSVDKFKFSGGDTFLGEDFKLNKATSVFMNSLGLNATAIGNHELDLSLDQLASLTKNAKYKMMGLNTEPDSKFILKDKITSSYVEEKNGNKYAIIGLMPFDLIKRTKTKEKFDGMNLQDYDSTVKEIQGVIDNYKKDGIDKVILLSHAGYASDVKMAKDVEGIDVIIGGHSHDLIEGVQEGKNLFYSQKTGNPTVITQAGKDGNYLGVLNLKFDEGGAIKTVQNNVTKTSAFKKYAPLRFINDSLLGKAEQVGVIASVEPTPSNLYTRENPHADLVIDAMKNELGTDIGILNSANLRGMFEVGDVDTRDLSGISPFKNKMTVIRINEAELVDALKFASESMARPGHKPGLLQVSGLKYTVNKSGNLLDVSHINASGKEEKIDINKPNPFRTYSVAIDDYYAKGGDGFVMLNKFDKAEKIFDFDKDKLVADYIRHLAKPIDIKTDGRITVVD